MLLLFELDYLIQYFCWLKPGDNIMVMKTKANEKYTCVLPDNPDAKEEVNFIYSIRFHCNCYMYRFNIIYPCKWILRGDVSHPHMPSC